MRFELRKYQRDYTLEVLGNLEIALDLHRNRGRNSAFALSALTGAGKTVIAAAVIEAMLHGSSDLDVARDRSVGFLWVTDDPALNRQTMGRLTESSGLTDAELVEIDDGFDEHSLQAGRVYFLNIQKLSRTSRLSKEDGDNRRYSIWQTVENTVKTSDVDLVLVLDEAHRGMQRTSREKTLVRHLIDGTRPAHVPSGGGHPHPVPVVWGISATPERFNDTMRENDARGRLDMVKVSNEEIRESGLVKDKIVLSNPEESGVYTSTLLDAAVDDILMLEQRWDAHADQHKEQRVLPALVVQVPDKVSDKRIKEIVDTIEAKWALGPDAIVHVFGEKTPVELPGRTIAHHQPERIQTNTDIRVVLAKEAISTGWDCPRAEVLYSERPAKDETHIAQIIGRIVRTPLARRIEDDEALNRVYCYLPNFDEDAVGKVIDRLQKSDDAVALDVERATTTFPRAAADGVFEVLDEMVSLPRPAPSDGPVKRAKKFASLLADDGLMGNANADLTAALNGALDGVATHRQVELDKLTNQVMAGRVTVTEVDYLAAGEESGGNGSDGGNGRSVAVSWRDLEATYQAAARPFKEGVLSDYHQMRRRRARDEGEEEMSYVKAQVTALATLEDSVKAVDARAHEWTQGQLSAHRIGIRESARANEYEQIKAQSPDPVPTPVVVPNDVVAPVEVPDRTDPSKRKKIDLHPGHVYANAEGKFAQELNTWETRVLEVELKSPSFVGWYRNPPQSGSSAALRIAYRQDDTWKSLQPDFIIISKVRGKFRVSIVDPHGTHLRDVEPKLAALARYAASEHGELFHRIEAIAVVDDQMMVLDMVNPTVREAVLAEEVEAESLYRNHGVAYG